MPHGPHQLATHPPGRLEALRDRFVALRFGMFIHFNMATYHEVEWVDPGRDPADFNPTRLDAGRWARAARSADMRYAVLTVKHHDGFCLWPSMHSAYGIKASPLSGRDLVREYVDAFRLAGIEPHLYFSVWDRTAGLHEGGPLNDRQLAFVEAQLTELLTAYGDIGSLTLDGWGNCGPAWDPDGYARIYLHVKHHQPDCLVTDHHQMQRVYRDRTLTAEAAYAINDVLHFEEPLGDWAKAPPGNLHAAHQGPTINRAWFWKQSFPDEKPLSVDAIVRERLDVLADRRCNLLLNVAPNRAGELDANVVRRLAEVGVARAAAESGAASA